MVSPKSTDDFHTKTGIYTFLRALFVTIKSKKSNCPPAGDCVQITQWDDSQQSKRNTLAINAIVWAQLKRMALSDVIEFIYLEQDHSLLAVTVSLNILSMYLLVVPGTYWEAKFPH